ncbi:MAG TPA: CaiB/BaiF CoA-transferase family protein [Frankiaceae bacterium]|nr:CaiB/BaiF CoA-transferase family protein [Frankiaceae bacterium]
MSGGPLAGVRVLDLSRMYPGAFCTQLLADLGADVLKVEGPGAGDGLRHVAISDFNGTHTALNRGKRSLVLNLKNSGAAGVLARLVKDADVVVESHRPGQLDQLGMGYDAMSAANPRIVWCSITGFGDHGPLAQAAGHDITYLGYAGMLGLLSDGPTSTPGLTIAVPMAASLAAVGILAAVVEAGRTGKGSRWDASMADSAMWALGENFALEANAPAPGWGTMAGRNVYTCADGRQVTVASTEPRSWAALTTALDAPDIADFSLSLGADSAVLSRLSEVFATKPAADWCANPGYAGGVGPVNTVADLVTDPAMVERGSIVSLAPSGIRVLANPIRPGGSTDGSSGEFASHGLTDPPELGADTDAALTAAGFTPDEISALRSERIVS